MREQNAGKHDIHDRGMIGDKNILLAFILLLSRKFNKVIPETHSIKHSETPQADKFIGIPVMFFAER